MASILDYGRDPWLITPRKRVVLAIALLLTILISASFWKWGRIVETSIKVQYEQRQCLNFERPAETIVFDSDPRQCEAIAAKDPSFGMTDSLYETYGYKFEPLTFIRSQSTSQLPKLYHNPLGTDLVFMHERISLSGHRRLVVVESLSDGDLEFRRVALIPANWFGSLTMPQEQELVYIANHGVHEEVLQNPYSKWGLSSEGDQRRDPQGILRYSFQIFMGQPDPKDTSHFTIKYQVNNLPGIIDGWLDDDEHIRMEAHGPWAVPTWTVTDPKAGISIQLP